MEASVCIEQKGTVEEITDRHVRIKIQRDSACGHCNAGSICNLSDISERIIETGDYNPDIKVGDIVDVTITRSMGNKAALFGYLLPFLLLISVLMILNATGMKEWLSGLISLGVLAPYFILLYLFRDRLRRSITFAVRKKVS
jgi:sigma-E factor negative regulatory protein RseC